MRRGQFYDRIKDSYLKKASFEDVKQLIDDVYKVSGDNAVLAILPPIDYLHRPFYDKLVKYVQSIGVNVPKAQLKKRHKHDPKMDWPLEK